jgi:hypothetical protein
MNDCQAVGIHPYIELRGLCGTESADTNDIRTILVLTLKVNTYEAVVRVPCENPISDSLIPCLTNHRLATTFGLVPI